MRRTAERSRDRSNRTTEGRFTAPGSRSIECAPSSSSQPGVRLPHEGGRRRERPDGPLNLAHPMPAQIGPRGPLPIAGAVLRALGHHKRGHPATIVEAALPPSSPHPRTDWAPRAQMPAQLFPRAAPARPVPPTKSASLAALPDDSDSPTPHECHHRGRSTHRFRVPGQRRQSRSHRCPVARAGPKLVCLEVSSTGPSDPDRLTLGVRSKRGTAMSWRSVMRTMVATGDPLVTCGEVTTIELFGDIPMKLTDCAATSRSRHSCSQAHSNGVRAGTWSRHPRSCPNKARRDGRERSAARSIDVTWTGHIMHRDEEALVGPRRVIVHAHLGTRAEPAVMRRGHDDVAVVARHCWGKGETRCIGEDRHADGPPREGPWNHVPRGPGSENNIGGAVPVVEVGPEIQHVVRWCRRRTEEKRLVRDGNGMGRSKSSETCIGSLGARAPSPGMPSNAK